MEEIELLIWLGGFSVYVKDPGVPPQKYEKVESLASEIPGLVSMSSMPSKLGNWIFVFGMEVTQQEATEAVKKIFEKVMEA